MAVYSPMSNNSFFFCMGIAGDSGNSFLFLAMGMAGAMAHDIVGIQTAILNSLRLFV